MKIRGNWPCEAYRGYCDALLLTFLRLPAPARPQPFDLLDHGQDILAFFCPQTLNLLRQFVASGRPRRNQTLKPLKRLVKGLGGARRPP